MNFFHRMFSSIRTKLLVFFLISCLIPFAILGFISWYNYQNTINKNAMLYNQQIMALSAAKLEDFLDKLDQFYYAVYNKSFNSNLSLIEESSADGVKALLTVRDTVSQLRSYYSLSHIIPYTSIVAEDGEIIWQNDLALTSDYRFDQADWFLNFRESNKSKYLSPPQRLPYHESRLTNSDSLYMTYAWKIARSPYYFLMEFDSQQISSLLSPLIKGKLDNLLLLADGRPFYSLRNQPLDQNQQSLLLLPEESGETPCLEMIGEKKFLINRYPVSDFSMEIFCMNELSELMKDVPSLKGFTLSLIAITFVLTILLAHFFSKQLVKPIQTLKAVTYEVMQGNLDVPIPPLTNDEIGELGKCIDQMLSHIRQLIQEKYQYSLREKEMQIHTLQSQINPHFLYNTLETISGIAENEGIEEISDIALSMAELYRYSISSSDRLVPIRDELNYVTHYLDIMKVRYGQRICTHFDIEDPAVECLIMKLTLQPLIENAIYHGLESKRTQGHLSVSVHLRQEFVSIIVQDDGVGMTEEQLITLKKSLTLDNPDTPVSFHIGLANVYQRMRLRFGEKCRLEIESSPFVGTTVTLLFPAMTEN